MQIEVDLNKVIDTLNQVDNDEELKAASNKDIIVSFGNTGSGKDTLCNLLIGNLLIPKDGKLF